VVEESANSSWCSPSESEYRDVSRMRRHSGTFILRRNARILTAPLIAVLVTFTAVLAWTGVHILWANAGALPPASVVYFTARVFLP
jgi:hypothetical protein